MEILEQAVDYGFVDFHNGIWSKYASEGKCQQKKKCQKEVEILKRNKMICWLKSMRIQKCIGKEAFDSMVHAEYAYMMKKRVKK